MPRIEGRFGVSEEQAEVEFSDRAAVDDALSTWRSERANEFATVYFTHEGGYRLHIVPATGDEEATIELPETDALTVVYDDPAPRSWADLIAARRQVLENFTPEQVSATGTDPLNGAITVSVADEETAAAVTELLGDVADVTVEDGFQQTSCTTPASRITCTPLRGGVEILGTNYSSPSGTLNYVYLTNNNVTYVINDMKAALSIQVGDTVHMSGRNSGTVDGQIDDLSHTGAAKKDWPLNSPLQFINGFGVDEAMVPGDSGGPSYWNSMGWGSLSGIYPTNSPTHTLVTVLEDALQATNQILCENSGCTNSGN